MDESIELLTRLIKFFSYLLPTEEMVRSYYEKVAKEKGYSFTPLGITRIIDIAFDILYCPYTPKSMTLQRVFFFAQVNAENSNSSYNKKVINEDNILSVDWLVYEETQKEINKLDIDVDILKYFTYRILDKYYKIEVITHNHTKLVKR